MAKAVEDDQKDWDLHLPQALFAYRTAVQESTGFTPFLLTFGRSPKLPVDRWIGQGDLDDESIQGYPEVVQKVHKRLVVAYTRVRKRLAAAHQKQKSAYDSKNRGESFAVGDRVWLFVPALKRGRTKKLASLWRGPYTVVDKTSPVNYQIQLIGGAGNLVVHRNRLKLCYGEPKPLPQKPKRSNPQPVASGQEGYDQPTPSNSVPYPVVGGYTCSDSPQESTDSRNSRPKRNRRPPDWYGDVVSH